ncbi:MAG: 3-phosphoshikimate 1-carboxyvinyltransferase [Proteobacteria bacterium]|nr:3-phosphoshikimate 1-carboxyvinyltransferase [Pseudomonadota bacterium]
MGEVEIPGDKSISHRAVMLGSIAHGTTHVSGCLMGDDVRSTIGAFRAMGVDIVEHDNERLSIHGHGFGALRAPLGPLDMGNSGTSIRLLAGLLASAPFAVEMSGDDSLRRRPMRRVTEPLALMGANMRTTSQGTPPLHLSPGAMLTAIRYELPVASAQVKSALLLAGLHTTGLTTVVEPQATRDHTERMLRAFGVELVISGNEISLMGPQSLCAADIHVPRDISSAAFFLVAASLVEGSELTLRGIGINPTRTGVISILREMGANIRLFNETTKSGEPVADIQVNGAGLRGIDIPAQLIPSAIDEFPAIFIAAACAEGVTRLAGAGELRHKESDRIDAMAVGLRALGVEVITGADSIQVTGRNALSGGCTIESRGDHRIAMSFAMAALKCDRPLTILNCHAIGTSFPGFVRIAVQAGLRIEQS